MPISQVKEEISPRLKRIRGQIEGIQRMVENERYCVDILLQILAARKALEKVSEIVLKNHVETCVTDSIISDNEDDKKQKVDELMDVFSRFSGK